MYGHLRCKVWQPSIDQTSGLMAVELYSKYHRPIVIPPNCYELHNQGEEHLFGFVRFDTENMFQIVNHTINCCTL